MRSHSGCGMDSALGENPVRTHPSVIESPRNASLAREPAVELAVRTWARLSRGVRSRCTPEAAGHVGQRSLAEFARGRLQDHSRQLGGGAQLCGHKPRVSMPDSNRRSSTAGIVLYSRPPSA
eukprot:scaffold23370_cov120-Isochrysis_galbana.AAC.10